MNEDSKEQAARFRRSDAEKDARVASVRARLNTGEAPRQPSGAGPTGWLGPALFWTALLALAAAGASLWLDRARGDTTLRVLPGERLALRRSDGGYRVPGEVAGRPVSFIVDTGASLTSIPARLGTELGIRECPAVGFDTRHADEPGCCRRASFHTANGTAEGCVARVPSIRFGGFEVRNAQVAVMPALGDHALLGMNVLRHFSLVQQGGTLSIGPGAVQ